MELTSEPGAPLACTAAPGSPGHHGLQLLATWAATAQPEAVRSIPATSSAAKA